jgi:hypothetical protein
MQQHHHSKQLYALDKYLELRKYVIPHHLHKIWNLVCNITSLEKSFQASRFRQIQSTDRPIMDINELKISLLKGETVTS